MSTYIRELVDALARELDCPLAAVVQADAATLLPPRVEPLVRPVSAGTRRALSGLRPVGRAALIHGLDVDLPLRPAAPTVTTVHDLSVFDVPWAFPRHRAAGERLLVRRSVRTADAVIAVSAFTASRVAAVLGRAASVIHEAPASRPAAGSAPSPEALRARHRLPERFVLHVGTVEPRKDLPTLAAACRQAGLALVLAGRVGDPSARPDDAIALGFVDGADLPGLYRLATVVAYPSLYEGFGLPPLEAMAAGAAVVATTAGALPEVLGDGARLVAPGDENALAGALAQLAGDSRARGELRARGQARAAAFSWPVAARATAEVYRGLGVEC